MRRSLLLLLLLIPLLASAQEKLSVVTLKNGTELKGEIKSIDPTDALIIVIAGIEMSIKMENVARIEEDKNKIIEVIGPQISLLKKEEKLIVTDKADYPESFDLKVGNEKIKMILVRGGDMNMGYDGKGSLSMNSDPVHQVGVTSFYISKSFITSRVVSEVTGKSAKKGFYKARWEKAFDIVLDIGKKAGQLVHLPTEAEWEYAACSKQQDILFSSCNSFEYCRDLFGDYNDLEYKVDPKGPAKGKMGLHVIRSYSYKKGKLSRYGSEDQNYFRIVIKAKDVK